MKTPLCIALITFVCMTLCQCTIEPVIYADATGRDVAWLGGSLLTKTKAQSRSITRPDGTVLMSASEGKTETSVPVTTGLIGLGKLGLTEAGDALRKIQ